MTSGRRLSTKGKQTRATILRTAVNIATIEGLEGLTIGRLAKELQMSKSGLFGHFGSKEELQLETVVTARHIFIDEVIVPARQADPGLARLNALVEAWLSYMDREVFPGGCFFMAAANEFDNRPGPVRDAIAKNMEGWLSYLTHAVRKAQQLGEISADVDPEQLGFEIHALYLGANWGMQLFDDAQAIERARRAIEKQITAVSVAG
ncbi:MAG: TetR/AcrR family transcriptional regulator [Chloroflexi bacterium]|nr:MAG: TetR/AcrR family transcriptional regulator [Chloroflexota bacterium]